MPTPATDTESGPPLLPDAEFDRIRDLSAADLEPFDPQIMAASVRTVDYYAGERQKLDVGSVFVGGRPYAKVLEEIQAQEKDGEEGEG
jgi:hypothetical protein